MGIVRASDDSCNNALGRIGCGGHRIHGDRRRANRGIGWEYVHVAGDDHCRLAYADVLPEQRGTTCAVFLQRAGAWFQPRGITTRRVMSDNGSGSVSRAWRATCATPQLRHLRPARTPRGPMARLSASFRRCSESGPTSSPTRRRRSAERRSVRIYGSRTASDPTRV